MPTDLPESEMSGVEPECPVCHYSLRGLDSVARCPECGEVLDTAFLNDAQGHRAFTKFRQRFVLLNIAGLLGLVATARFAGGMFCGLAIGFGCAMLVLTLMTAFELGLVGGRSHRRRPDGWTNTEYTMVLGAFAVVWVFVLVLASV